MAGAKSSSAPCRQRSTFEYGPSSFGFPRIGFDEIDKVSGEATAELLEDGSIKVAFDYHNSD